MIYIDVERGMQVFVEDFGPHPGRDVLFVHGWPVNRNMFEYQYNVLPSHGFRCIGMDLRGFGKSDRPWDGYSYDRLADDVFTVIKVLKLREITLVGFSVGGAVSIRYMARHSGYRVSRLVLVSAAAPVFTRRPDYPYGLPAEAVNELMTKTYTDRPKMLSDFGGIFFASTVSPDFMNWFHSLGLEASGHATSMVLASLRDEDLRGDLDKIQVPTGIFHGVQDKVVPFQSALETRKGIVGSELYPFENAGHGVFYDQLFKFNDTLISFLNQ